MPQYGSSLYYDLLTGRLGAARFVDKSKMLSLLGLKWLRLLTPRGIRAALAGDDRPMINLPFLLRECVEVPAARARGHTHTHTHTPTHTHTHTP